MQRDSIAGVLWDVHPVVHGVRRPRRNNRSGWFGFTARCHSHEQNQNAILITSNWSQDYAHQSYYALHWRNHNSLGTNHVSCITIRTLIAKKVIIIKRYETRRVKMST